MRDPHPLIPDVAGACVTDVRGDETARVYAADDRRARRAGPPVLIALFVSPFEYQHRADEAWDRRDRGAHLEGFMRALEAGHQFPAFLSLVIGDIFHVRRQACAPASHCHEG